MRLAGFTKNNGLACGIEVGFFPSGRLYFKGNKCNGKRHGTAVTYRKSGEICYYDEWVNDIPLTAHQYRKSGLLKRVVPFADKKKHGIEIEFDFHTCQLIRQTNWVSNKKTGEELKYKDDVINVRTMWLDDKRNGYEIHYYSNGQIQSKAQWVNGELHGEEIQISSNGNLRIHTEWINGVKGKEEQHYSDGIVSFNCVWPKGRNWRKAQKSAITSALFDLCYIATNHDDFN